MNQSGSLLVASSPPPVTNAAKDHNPPTAGPARERTVANADAIAANARRAGPIGNTGARPDTSTTTAEKPAANTAARRANRRTQSRAVV
jgi:hypothetical protein